MAEKIKKKKWKAWLRLLLWIFIIQFVLLNISAFLHAGKLTKFYSKEDENRINPPKNIFGKTWWLFSGPKIAKPSVSQVPYYKHDTVYLTTKSNLKLEAWYAKTDSVAKGTVILFHGLANSKSSVLQEAGEFRYMGYNVMLVDFRAHGNSHGNKTTIGWFETEDVKLTYEWLQKKGETKIFLWGFSMGAASIIKSVAENKLNPSGIILEMPFGSLHRHFQGRGPTLGFPSQPYGALVTFWAGVRRGFNGFKFNNYRFGEKLNCPVLLQWADKDIYVNKTEAESIFRHIGSENKKMVVFENAVHGSLLQQNDSLWRKEVDVFMKELSAK